MTAEEHFRRGELDEALASLRDAVKKSPADAKLRIFLFQLHAVRGEWEKALTQLQVLRDLDADSMLLAQIFTPILQCEALRGEVFAGRRGPLVFGEPEEWVGLLVQANQLVAEGNYPASRELRERAFEAAPAIPGKLNDREFEWVADADSRLGPILEAIVDAKYYWIPFVRIQAIQLEPPSDLRNLVWAPVRFTWTNGGESTGLIPTRYAGTETSADPALRLARKTAWEQKSDDLYLGLGQRVLATNDFECPLLELRKMEFSPASVPA